MSAFEEITNEPSSYTFGEEPTVPDFEELNALVPTTTTTATRPAMMVPWDATPMDALCFQAACSDESQVDIMGQLLAIQQADEKSALVSASEVVSLFTIPHLLPGSPQYLQQALGKLDMLRLLYSHVQSRTDSVLSKICEVESSLPELVKAPVHPSSPIGGGMTAADIKIDHLRSLSTLTSKALRQQAEFHAAKGVLEEVKDLYHNHVAQGARQVALALVQDVAQFFTDGTGAQPDRKLVEGVAAPLATVDASYKAANTVLEEKFELCVVEAQSLRSGLQEDLANVGGRLCSLALKKCGELERRRIELRTGTDEFDPQTEELTRDVQTLERAVETLCRQVVAIVKINREFDGEPLLNDQAKQFFDTAVAHMERSLGDPNRASATTMTPLNSTSNQLVPAGSQFSSASSQQALRPPSHHQLGVRRSRDEDQFSQFSSSTRTSTFIPSNRTSAQTSARPSVRIPSEVPDLFAPFANMADTPTADSPVIPKEKASGWLKSAHKFLFGDEDSSDEEGSNSPSRPSRGPRTE